MTLRRPATRLIHSSEEPRDPRLIEAISRLQMRYIRRAGDGSEMKTELLRDGPIVNLNYPPSAWLFNELP
jgi:hypothetical protein